MTLDSAPESLATALPGRWVVRATNFPMWLRGDRHAPVIEYAVLQSDPLVLSDTVEYIDDRRGPRRVLGVDRARGDGFVWRGTGVLRMLRSRWQVAGLHDSVLCIRFARSAVTPAGIDVLVREGARVPELRRFVAEDLDRLGLTTAEFAGLGWLDDPAVLS